MSNIDRNAPCPCGSTKKYKHCCQRKDKALNATRRHETAMVSAWLQLGMQHLRTGQIQQAKNLYDQVLLVSPLHPDALQWMGVIAHKQGHSDRAIELISDAIAQSPSNAFIFSTLGNVLKEMGDADSAIVSYRQALALRPRFPEAQNNLGAVLASKNQYFEAIDHYKNAIELLPNYADAHSNMGAALKALGRFDDAEYAYKKAILADANCVQALLNLGNILHANAPDDAVVYLKRALILQPDNRDAWISLGKICRWQGDLDQASACFRRAYKLKPSDGLRVLDALMLPPILGTNEQIIESRTRFEAKLDQLTSDGVNLRDPVKELVDANFFLAYHGQNDRDIQQKVARFFEVGCPSLLYVARHCQQPKILRNRKRIGFFSTFIFNHSVSRSFSRIVEALADQPGFEVTLISPSNADDEKVREAYPRFQGGVVRVAADLSAARDQIATLELDTLVYLDIGMDPFSYFLAYARLAHIQCVAGGHPVTTGVAAIDYFLSSALMEGDDSDDHYSEKLVRLPLGLFYFERPNLPEMFKSREELGLPAAENLYLCPMVLHKLHPDFDEAIARILELDPAGRVILVADKRFSVWQKLLENRFEKTIDRSLLGRIDFIPWVSKQEDFISLNRAVNVVLDPFHFGMGTTAIFTCAVGTPFVTKPSKFMRGRTGLFCAKILDVMECVVDSCEEYAQKAVLMANDNLLHQRIHARVMANNCVLFENQQVIADVVEFFGAAH
jgi:protein O-GlcNAc transferase